METTTDQTTQQLMFSLIEVWKTSGKTQLDFCKEKDLAYHKFHYWFRKYNHQNTPPEAGPAFVRMIPPTRSQGGMELIYPDGRKLVFHQGVDAAFLRQLLG